VWSMPVVLVGEGYQCGCSLLQVLISLCVGPFSEGCLDKVFRLTVGAWRVGPGAAVLEPERPAGVAEAVGLVARPVVGEDTTGLDRRDAGTRWWRQPGSGRVTLLSGWDIWRCSRAIRLPVQRWRRCASTRTTSSAEVSRGEQSGWQLRSRNLASPSSRNRLTHFATLSRPPTTAMISSFR